LLETELVRLLKSTKSYKNITKTTNVNTKTIKGLEESIESIQ